MTPIPTLAGEDINQAINIYLDETLLSETDCEEVAAILNARMLDIAVRNAATN